MEETYTLEDAFDEVFHNEWDEIFKWKPRPISKYEFQCGACGKRIVYDLGLKESIQALKCAGWQLRDEGPCCTDCQEKE